MKVSCDRRYLLNWVGMCSVVVTASGTCLLSACGAQPSSAARTALQSRGGRGEAATANATDSLSSRVSPTTAGTPAGGTVPAATDSPPHDATQSTAGTTDSVCDGSNLTLSTAPGGGGHAGSGDFLLVFTNHGASACLMSGYPRVVAVHLGRIVRQARPIPEPLPTVTLAAYGGRSAADLNVWNLPLRPSSAPCGSTTDVIIRATPPGAATTLTLPERYFSTCDEQVGAVAPYTGVDPYAR
jgi:Protein of unknown function (DUF4232)